MTSAVDDSIYTRIYGLIARVFLPDANMPLFTAISGFVYYYLRIYKGKYVNTIDFFKNKIKRLFLPYFIIGTIVVFTIFDWSPVQILYGDAHHLWFCAMLFWCFVTIRVYERMPLWARLPFVIVCIASSCITIPTDLLYLYRSLHYFPYFLVGYYLVESLPTIQSKPKYIMYVILGTFFLLLLSLLNIKYVSTLARMGYYFAYTITLFSVIPIHIKSSRFVKLISNYSFGIYVFHEWFLWNLAHIEPMEDLIVKHQILYPIIVFVVVLPISILLTKEVFVLT